MVSLSPALTHTIEELGGRACVVGQTPWCGIEGVPAVGSLEDRNLEAIAGLRPTLVVRQSSLPDPGLERVAAECGASVVSIRLDSVADVRESIRVLAAVLPPPAAGARAAVLERLAAPGTAGNAEVTADPVLFLYASDPPAAFGRGTYLDDLWTSLGGRNAVEARGYPAMTPEDVVRLRPSAIVCIGGPTRVPAWAGALDAPWIVIDAPELLEPSARMLRVGPSRLREADGRIAVARHGRPRAPALPERAP